MLRASRIRHELDWPLDDVNLNVKKFDKVHHMIQRVPSGKERKVKICRCWMSKKFPICDDTHKQMVEVGDNVGPYIAYIAPYRYPSASTTEVDNSNTNAATSSVAATVEQGAGAVAGEGVALGAVNHRRLGNKSSSGVAANSFGRRVAFFSFARYAAKKSSYLGACAMLG